MSRVRVLFVVLATVLSFALTGAGTATSSPGAIVFDGSPGTGAPPATLGPYTMTPFALDPQPYGLVGSVAGPTGAVTFSPLLDHVRVTDGWQTWSNGYLGDVYWTYGALSATVTLPPDTSAFYLYAEPNPFAVFEVTAYAQDGTTSGPIAVDGYYGAQYFGFYATGGERVASITITSSIDFAIGEFGIATGSVPHGSIVGLGDSYSSGEGNPPFFAGTDGPSDYCHRSPAAYPEVLGAMFGTTPLFYACSGAVTSNITTTFHDTEPPQITRPGVDATADLVTMTIGGNDAGFSDVLKACIEQKLKADAINALVGAVGRWLGLGQDPNCSHSDRFVSSVNTGVDNVFWPVKSTELQLKSVVDPVDTSIVVAGYPRLFPSDHDAQDCLQLEPFLTNDDQDMMNSAGDRLIGVLQQAAGEAGVNFVDVRGAFAGHEICGSAGSYLNAISIASGNGGSCIWSLAGHCIIPGLPIVGSFHPNASGHAYGYAGAIESYISTAAVRTPAGFPANPVPLPDPPSTTVRTAVGFGTLTVHEVTAGSADCEGTYQAGQQVTFSGDGFVPGAAVEVWVTSPGLGDTGDVQVAALTADADGHVAGTARIPLAATGFTQPGAIAGIVFLDALGEGSAAEHQDDVAMVGLMPHDGSCGTLEQLPFHGFTPPVANLPQVNPVEPGQSVPVKFVVPGSNGTLDSILAAGYPQSAPVSCWAPESLTSGEPTLSDAIPSTIPGDHYNYVWKTDASWRGCRELIVKLIDGTYHRAVFDFGA